MVGATKLDSFLLEEKKSHDTNATTEQRRQKWMYYITKNSDLKNEKCLHRWTCERAKNKKKMATTRKKLNECG